jgi:Rho GTPase-activating protein 1
LTRTLGLQDEGLFRRSPSSVLLKQVQQAYDRGIFSPSSYVIELILGIIGHVVSLNTFADPYLAAVLLKKYLRDLPDPLFPEKVYPVIKRCPATSDDATDMSSILYIRETLLPELVPCAAILLSHILRELILHSHPDMIISFTGACSHQIYSMKFHFVPRLTKWTRTILLS